MLNESNFRHVKIIKPPTVYDWETETKDELTESAEKINIDNLSTTIQKSNYSRFSEFCSRNYDRFADLMMRVVETGLNSPDDEILAKAREVSEEEGISTVIYIKW